MTRAEYLDILLLRSALESWSFSAKVDLPDYLHDRLSETINKLSEQVLGENEESK